MNYKNNPQLSLIPLPSRMEIKEGSFTLTPTTKIVTTMGLEPEINYFLESIKPAMGFSFVIKHVKDKLPETKHIFFKLDPLLIDLGEEGYQLHVEKNKILLLAYKPAGIFYGIQTLRQLLPIQIFKNRKVKDIHWNIPCVEIEDKPRFSWRGQLFDCGRHFFTIEIIKRTLDLMALYKMNRFHWHITEDQGWRLEIKRYPQLTQTGAWRIDAKGKRYGGFYTQKEVQEIVAYADERHITIVPEIEMPGHSLAALASYPELGCTGGHYTVGNTWGVKKDVYCAGNEIVFHFLEHILDEVIQLFPSQYIHIGGDECPKDRWKNCSKCQTRIKNEKLKDEAELQSYFIKRIDKYLTAKGRRLIGWDEILEGGLSPNAVVQSWRSVNGGINAVQQHHDCIMSPHFHCYLDYTYPTTSLEKVYHYEPIPPEIPRELSHHILGIEGCIWTEHIPDRDRMDFMVYPRISALSETAWTPASLKNLAFFEERLKVHFKRFDFINVKYGNNHIEELMKDSVMIGKWDPEHKNKSDNVLEWDVSKFIKEAGKYCIIPWYSDGYNGGNIHSIKLLENGKIIGNDDHIGIRNEYKIEVDYYILLKKFKPGARYTVQAFLATNGVEGSTGEMHLVNVR